MVEDRLSEKVERVQMSWLRLNYSPTNGESKNSSHPRSTDYPHNQLLLAVSSIVAIKDGSVS